MNTYPEWAEGEEVDKLPEEQRRELEERALVCTPEDVVDQLEEYRDALGEDVTSSSVRTRPASRPRRFSSVSDDSARRSRLAYREGQSLP